METPIRLGLIGCGRIAMAHAAALRSVAEDGLVRVVAAADPDSSGIDTVTSIVGPIEHRTDDGHAVINDPNVDAVVIITPTRFHREYIAAAAVAGKPVFTEKPLAPTFDVVRDVVATVHAAGIPTQVGFQSRFHPLVRRIRSMVQDGSAGAPMAYMLRDDQFWPAPAIVPGHSEWRSQRSEAGGGALLEHSIHSCDVLSWCFGPATRVYASTRSMFGYDVEDVAALTVEHESGVVGTLISVFNGVQHREERRLEVFFERATVEMTSDFLIGAPEDSFLVHSGDDEHAVVYEPSEIIAEQFRADGFDPERQVWVYQYFAHHAFATALLRGEAPSPNIDDALNAHAMVEAAYRSAVERRPVDTAELLA
ncbi:MAG: Gfo/Idh/MocA family protein [Acidimicrobiia bacterium]